MAFAHAEERYIFVHQTKSYDLYINAQPQQQQFKASTKARF